MRAVSTVGLAVVGPVLALALAAAAAVFVACGGRTGLDAPLSPDARDAQDAGRGSVDARVGLRDASIARDATIDASSPPDVTLVPFDAPPILTGCRSALAPGAPAPIPGYCSTQSNVAPSRVPRHPRVLWATQLPANSAPSELVVDRTVRAYIASCSTPLGPELGTDLACLTVFAMEPNGTVDWSHTFLDSVRGLYLASGGALRLSVGTPGTLFELDATGHPTEVGALPPNVTYGYVGSDGSLYGYSVDYASEASDALVKMTSSGTVLWSQPSGCHDCIATMAVAPDDAVVAGLVIAPGDGTISGVAVSFDTLGHLLWRRTLPGFPADQLAIAEDGSTRVVLWQGPTGERDAGADAGPATAALLSLSASGETLFLTDVHQDPEQTGDDTIVLANDGTTVFRTFTHLNAVDAVGTLRWSTPLPCPNCAFAAAADPDGGLVALLDDVEGIDLATGNVLFQGIVAPEEGGTRRLTSAMVLGPPGVLFGATSGGEVFVAWDP